MTQCFGTMCSAHPFVVEWHLPCLFSLFLLTCIKNRIGFRQKKYNVYTCLGKIKYNVNIYWGIYNCEDEMM